MSKKTMHILSECIPVFTMLQDENRQQILMLLFDKQQMTVNELTQNLELSRPAVSHHMKLLLDSNIVQVKKSGKERYYYLNMDDALMKLKQLVNSIEDDMNKTSV